MSAVDPTLSSTTVVTGKLHVVRKGHSKRFVDTPSVALGPVRRPARVAIMLALAHKIQNAIDRGAVHDRAEVARRLGLTRARVTQLLNLTLLAPNIQERILFAESLDGVKPVSERAVRAAVATSIGQNNAACCALARACEKIEPWESSTLAC
jgi:hypothetical protein